MTALLLLILAATPPPTVITSESPGKHAGILWVHWLGTPGTTNRTELLAEAQALAPQGATSVVIDAPWSAPHWFENLHREGDAETCRDAVHALRAALNLLASRKDVDPKRLAIVGHDFGGMFGLVAGQEDGRVHTFAVLTAAPHLSDWFLLGEKPRDLAAHRKTVEPFDPTRALAKLPSSTVLFQFADRDAYVSAEQARELVQAFRGPSTVKHYPVGHALLDPHAKTDRTLFLTKQLGLKDNPPR